MAQIHRLVGKRVDTDQGIGTIVERRYNKNEGREYVIIRLDSGGKTKIQKRFIKEIQMMNR